MISLVKAKSWETRFEHAHAWVLSKIKPALIFCIVAFFIVLVVVKILFITKVNDPAGVLIVFHDGPLFLLLCIVVLMCITLLYGVSRLVIKKCQLGATRYNQVATAVLLVFVAIFGVIWINYADSSLYVSDANNVYVATLDIIETQEIPLASYLSYSNQQVGLAGLFLIMQHIFGSDFFPAFQYLNLLFVEVMFFFIVQIVREMFHEDTITLGAIATLFFMWPPIMLSKWCYNDIISISLSVIAIYLLLLFYRNNMLRYSVASAVLLGFAFLIRGNTGIIIVATVCFYFYLLGRNRLKAIIGCAVTILIILAMHLAYLQLFSTLYNLDQQYNRPAIHWTTMSMQTSDSLAQYDLGFTFFGWWNNFGSVTMGEAIAENAVDAVTSQQQSQVIAPYLKERLAYFSQNPLTALNLYGKKFISTWTEPTFQALEYSTMLNKPQGNVSSEKRNSAAGKTMHSFQDGYQFIIYFFATIALIAKRKSLTAAQLFPMLIIFGGFLFHEFIWETKARYVLPYFILMTPFAAVGIVATVKFLWEKIALQMQDMTKPIWLVIPMARKGFLCENQLLVQVGKLVYVLSFNCFGVVVSMLLQIPSFYQKIVWNAISYDE